MDDEKVKVCAEFVTQNLKKIEEHLRKNPDMTLGWPDAKVSASCWNTTACSWSACWAGKVCELVTGETATDIGHDDNKEFVAACSTEEYLLSHQEPSAGGPGFVQDS